MAYYIGLDWGQRKIGVAFGDDETRQAFGFGLVENTNDVYEALALIAREYDAVAFVIGRSGHMVHDDNTQDIDAFAQNVERVTGVRVLFAPEMLSTREAQENLKAAGKKNVAAQDDIEAARIILQGFLDAQNTKHP